MESYIEVEAAELLVGKDALTGQDIWADVSLDLICVGDRFRMFKDAKKTELATWLDWSINQDWPGSTHEFVCSKDPYEQDGTIYIEVE